MNFSYNKSFNYKLKIQWICIFYCLENVIYINLYKNNYCWSYSFIASFFFEDVISEKIVKDKFEYAEEVREEETLSIQDKELELIIKALERNNRKRKAAASELGISERTLYRKIKQYNIDLWKKFWFFLHF